MKKIIVLALMLVVSFSAFSQDSCKISLKASADLVNRDVFRGMMCDQNSAHIQPTFSIYNNVFEVGAWGSYGISDSYCEIDAYAKININKLTVGYVNYNMPKGVGSDSNFSKDTYNKGEVNLAYSDKVNVLVATFLYGDSKNYSTYAEISKQFELNKLSINLFIGVTPFNGYYGSKFNLVNVGVTGTSYISINEKVKLPIYATLCGNPDSKKVYFIIGVTIK